MTVIGIKEAGHKDIQPLLCHVAEAVTVMTGVAIHVSRVWQLKETTGEAVQLPLSHICFTHCLFTIRLLSEYSGGNFAPADLIFMTV